MMQGLLVGQRVKVTKTGEWFSCIGHIVAFHDDEATLRMSQGRGLLEIKLCDLVSAIPSISEKM
jgi:hypothetical protein